ncbi:MAG: hypothetical protein PHO36_01005 [Parabacteroides sp.]|nr:hypothetical protein [Parabacteroides sp.]
MKTKDWKPEKQPIALLIGHDPRLKASDTIAEYSLFANYYFDSNIKDRTFKRKYKLAASAFNQITDITNGNIKPEEIYVTNLCNLALPRALDGKIVYIPEDKALEGFENIKRILSENPTIKYIFPMSQQVNYWLQMLGLYDSENSFKEFSAPKPIGVENSSPYYEATKQRAFLMICGNKYKVTDSNQVVIPILHAKCYPLNERFKAYKPAYDRISSYFL